jgi:hypothetical protein
VALLAPAKLATAGYAESLRRRLASETRLERVAPLDESAAASFGAAVYPMALVAARASPRPGEPVVSGLGRPDAGERLSQDALCGGGPWVLTPDADRVRRRLRAELPALGERWRVQLGVKTGADDVFLTAHAASGTMPALRGRDVSAFRVEPRLFLYWTHDPAGRPLAELPDEMSERFAPHLDRLRRRADYRSGPPWQVYRTGLARAPHRVLWADLGRRLGAAAPAADVVPLNTVYGIATRERAGAAALVALLNARWLTALACAGADPARGGFYRFNARVVSQLPVPPASSPAWDTLAALGERGLTDDAVVADLLTLDALDRRALDRLAPTAR